MRQIYAHNKDTVSKHYRWHTDERTETVAYRDVDSQPTAEWNKAGYTDEQSRAIGQEQ